METFDAHYESLKEALNKYMPGAPMELIDQAVVLQQGQHG